MKALLKTEVTFSTMFINFNSQLNGNDEKTHNVTIKGHTSHDYIWEKNRQETFEFGFFADPEFCVLLEEYLERKLQARDCEQFPKEV